MARVSCLTVTLGTPARLPMLRRAIADYLAQSHADRELVIVADARASPDVAALVATSGREDVRLLRAEGVLTLGALRNLSVRAARGDIICQWDDDDIHHPDRIARQLAGMTAAGAEAGILQDVLHFRPAGPALRWINWAATPAGGHPGTLMAMRAGLPPYAEAGATASLGEDLDLLARLAAHGPVHRLAGEPWLYLYVSHGANSWPAAHHAMLADTLAVSPGLLRRREAALRAGLAPISLDAGIPVEGAQGLGFLL